MIPTIPTYAGKSIGDRVAREHPLVLLILSAGMALLLYVYPYATLAALTVLYFLLMPLGIRRFLRLNKLVGDDEELRPTLSGPTGE